MISRVPKAIRLHVHDIEVEFEHGSISFPRTWYPRLAAATDEQLLNYRLSAKGIHWPDLDEDLSIAGLLRDCEDDT